jgi:hypothetical protein
MKTSTRSDDRVREIVGARSRRRYTGEADHTLHARTTGGAKVGDTNNDTKEKQ